MAFPQKVVTIDAIYYPPYSTTHPVTNATFFNEINEKLFDLAIEDNSNSIVLGDLNIPVHINDGQNYDSRRLNEIITLLG